MRAGGSVAIRRRNVSHGIVWMSSRSTTQSVGAPFAHRCHASAGAPENLWWRTPAGTDRIDGEERDQVIARRWPVS